MQHKRQKPKDSNGLQTNTTENTVECDKVVKSTRIDNEQGNLHGYMQEVERDGRKAAVPVWVDDDRVTYSGYWERIRRSYIPGKYLVNESKGLDWSLYGLSYDSSIKNIRKTLNKFVAGFERICSEGIGLYINSLSHGSGKTLLGCMMACKIMENFNHVSAKYTTVPDYLELMKGKGDQRLEKNREYRECTLLVLDEMGSGKTDWDKDILRNLISYRMSQHKPIIYISSCPMEKLTGDSQIIAFIEDMSIDIGLPPVNVRNKLAEQRKNELLEKAAQQEDKAV